MKLRKGEDELNKQYNQIIHPASYYRQVFTGYNSQAVSEDDKITLRLSPVRSPENHATDSQDHIRTLYGPPPRIEGFNLIQSLRGNAEAAVNEINLDKLAAADQIL